MNYQDEALMRMEQWEKEHNQKLSSLSEQEWLETITHILPLTMNEAQEWLNELRGQQQ